MSNLKQKILLQIKSYFKFDSYMFVKVHYVYFFY